jgi:hypothetical protein
MIVTLNHMIQSNFKLISDIYEKSSYLRNKSKIAKKASTIEIIMQINKQKQTKTNRNHRKRCYLSIYVFISMCAHQTNAIHTFLI